MWRKRYHLKKQIHTRDPKVISLINRAFYEQGYIRQALLEIKDFLSFQNRLTSTSLCTQGSPIAMNRQEKILRYINKNGHGIEIGPSHEPIASKKNGYKVHIIDYMSREQLIAKYKDHSVNLGKIEEVDFVWRGENFSELTGKTKYYDWIIASHAIEHLPDLISFFKNCETILKNDGVISLAVPDKRYCFDHYRPITGISNIIDSYYQKNKIHTPGKVAEYYLNVVSKGGNIAWDSTTNGDYKFIHSLENALQGMKSVINEKSYLDIHAWCFVPSSFRLIIHDLHDLGLIHFQEVEFFPTTGCEFYITLSQTGKGINKSRLEMLNMIESEINNAEPTNHAGTTLSPIALKRESLIKRLISRFIRRCATHTDECP